MQDKIYSRPRLKLPKIRSFDGKRKRKLYYFILIWVVVIITVNLLSRSLEPVFEKICVERAKEIGTRILNKESSDVLKGINYDDLIIVEKDNNENVRMVKSNIVQINLLASDITYKIQESLSKLEKENIEIALGALTGSRILAGVGPNVSLRIVPVGSIETKFKSEFLSVGINQTMHRLYLIVNCEVNILTAYNTIDTNIENQILFAENIIVGEIPDTYYNLEGIGKDDIMEVIN